MELSSHIFPLGDAALTLDLGSRIDPECNKKAVAIGAWMNKRAFAGVKDIIISYSSVSVLYDVYVVRMSLDRWKGGIYELMAARLREAERAVDQVGHSIRPAGWLDGGIGDTYVDRHAVGAVPYIDGLTTGGTAETLPTDNPVIRIPVCYEAGYAPDLDALAAAKGLSRAEVIERHMRTTFRVYMIGFLPGFPYMGKVDPAIAMPRKERPVPVAAGSVGIAGDQTGIYPFNSPGGWQIIGRTPLKLFDPAADVPVALTPGDYVGFYAIGHEQFQRLAAVPDSKPLKKNDDRCQS